MKANLSSAKKSTRRVLIGSFVAFSSLLAACGGDDSSSSSSQAPLATEAPATTEGTPTRIVSLSPTHTEILFAIGAGDQVVAVDSMSNYPAEAEAVLTDLSAYEPNVEAISALEPDLVVIGDDYNGLAEQLSAVGIESWTSLAPASLEEAYQQIEDLGKVVGQLDAAVALSAEMQSGIEAILAATEVPSMPTSYYHELDDMSYSVTGNTFIGSIYALFDLRNIADATEGDTDYPQLSAEFIVSQDPNLIFLADGKCCGVTPEVVGARPGWSDLSAVKNGNIIVLDDDVASRWGPRLVEFVQAVADGLQAFNKTVG